MAGSVFGGCCGLGDMQSLQEAPDSKAFSPIISLDSYISDWAYEYFKDSYDRPSGCTNLCKKYPKRKDVDINIAWDGVTFTYSAPTSASKPDSNSAAHAIEGECNGNEETEAGMPLVKQHSASNTAPQHGMDPHNKMESLHEESFSVKFENTTDNTCTTTLSSERTVKASYEVDVHSSVQVEHNVQLTLTAGGDESMGKIEGAYEFNKMLEQYKGEKTCKEMETKLNTECPVEVKKNSTTEARFITTYQNYKKTLHIESRFQGRLNIEIIERMKKKGKKNKNRYYRHLGIDVADVFEDLKNEGESPLSRMITIEGDRPNQVVSYTSSATFSSSYGVDQHVKILNYPLPNSHPSDTEHK